MSSHCDDKTFKKRRLPKKKTQDKIRGQLTATHLCNVCHAVFKRSYDLKRHMRQHTGDKPFVCSFCNKGFADNSNLVMHKRIHTGETPYKCEICGKGFKQLGHITTHKLTHSDIKAFECKICGSKFRYNSSLKAHLRKHIERKDQIKKFQCECNLCDKLLPDSRPCKERQLQSLEKGFKCAHCEQSFTYKAALRSHMKLHFEGTVFECGVCRKGFFQKSNLERHILIHDLETPNYTCKKCKETFDDRIMFRIHLKTHEKVRKLCPCEVCGKTFKDPTNLKRHFIIHTGLKPFTCKICEKTFNVRRNLERHIGTHKNSTTHAITYDGLYPCSECVSVFPSLSALIQHRKVHISALRSRKIFKCKYCPNIYGTLHGVQKHMLNHTGRRQNFSCAQCGKDFSQIYNLRAHLRVHTGEKPYLCMVCQKAFRFRSGLTQHLKTHTDPANENNIYENKLAIDKMIADASHPSNSELVDSKDSIIIMLNNNSVEMDNQNEIPLNNNTIRIKTEIDC